MFFFIIAEGSKNVKRIHNKIFRFPRAAFDFFPRVYYNGKSMENIVLIGMPSSGKSTVGKMLAAKRGLPFLDGDDLIRARTGESLAATIASAGAEGFIKIEEEVLCRLTASGAVIATGGSAVYSARAMAHLGSIGKIFYLKIPEEAAEKRIPDFTARGVVMRGKIASLKELYAERAPLYEKYADVTVDCGGKTPQEIAEEIIKA